MHLFHFETQTKQILVFFQKRQGKSLIWQKLSAKWKFDLRVTYSA